MGGLSIMVIMCVGLHVQTPAINNDSKIEVHYYVGMIPRCERLLVDNWRHVIMIIDKP